MRAGSSLVDRLASAYARSRQAMSMRDRSTGKLIQAINAIEIGDIMRSFQPVKSRPRRGK